MFAFGNKHPYHEVVISAQSKSNNPIALAVHDQRHYIVNASKSATFIGSMRSGVGIPYDITTKSDKPLADDFLGIIKQAMEKAGNKLFIVPTRSGLSKEEVYSELSKTQAPRSIYIDIREWKTDTYMKADLYCLVNLYVLDQNGATIAETSVKANAEGFGGSFWNPKKAAKKGALKAVKLKLEALINDKVVVKALES
jgi:hypothetical protein